MIERNQPQHPANTNPLRAPMAPVGGTWDDTTIPVQQPEPAQPVPGQQPPAPPWPEPVQPPVQQQPPPRERRRVEKVIRDNPLLAGCLALAAVALLCGGGSVWADRTFFGGGPWPYIPPNPGIGRTPTPPGEATPTPSQAEGACPDPTQYGLKPDASGYSPGFGVNTTGQGGAVVALYYPATSGEQPLGGTIYGTQLITTEIPAQTNEQFPRAAGRAWIYSASCTPDQIAARESAYDQTYQVPHVDLTTLQQEGLAVDPSQASTTRQPKESVLAQVRAKDPFRVSKREQLPTWRRVGFRQI